MNYNFFRRKKSVENVKQEWNELGEKYASDVNAMVEYGETHGWDNWKGEEPEDKRVYLAENVLSLLKDANKSGKIDDFRSDFPPAHFPFVKYFEEKGQSVGQLYFIENQKIIFLTGTSYQKRQAYLLVDNEVVELDTSIDAVGKSKQNDVFAILSNNTIVTTQGWQGEQIASFLLRQNASIGVTEMMPFNDGLRVLLVTSEGIYLISQNEEMLIHPVEDDQDDQDDEDSEDEEDGGYTGIDMENATLSNSNDYIVVGDQCSAHRVLNTYGVEIGSVGQQSSYPHFCLFSKNDQQLITNSCHFYNGVTIGVNAAILDGIAIEEYQESSQYVTIDEDMRVYSGFAVDDYYILGDAYGYIKAFDMQGKCLWRHFLGSTISGMCVSDDGSTLWVGSYSGTLHKLKLGHGNRDNHTIGNGNHYEELRVILWKDEPILKW